MPGYWLCGCREGEDKAAQGLGLGPGRKGAHAQLQVARQLGERARGREAQGTQVLEVVTSAQSTN